MSINFSQSPFNSANPGVIQANARKAGDWFGDIINVLEYGADNTGSRGCGANIQAAFDAAYGPAGSSNTQNGHSYLNKGVYFPAGTYHVDQQLFLNYVEGAWIFGDGQYATRLLYTGPDSQTPPASFTALLTPRTVTISRIEGLTFDISGSNAVVIVNLINYTGISNDGTAISWVDCGFVGDANTSDGFAAIGSFGGGSGQDGSEQFFLKCRFESCAGNGGLRLAQANALNYTLVGCTFNNCTTAISAITGGTLVVMGCDFHNSSVMDVYVKQGTPATIVGCTSDSSTFCCTAPTWIAAVDHTGSGYFWDLFATGEAQSPDFRSVVIEGCNIPSGTLHGDNSCSIYMVGNQTNSGFLSNFTGTPVQDM